MQVKMKSKCCQEKDSIVVAESVTCCARCQPSDCSGLFYGSFDTNVLYCFPP